MKKKKELTVVVVNDFDYVQGGASKVAIDTANLLVEKNITVYFFSGSSINNDELSSKVVRICTNQGEALRDKNKLRGFFNGIYNFKAKRKFSKLLNSLDKDNTIIHYHGWTKCLSSSVFDIAFKRKFKTVLTLHDYFTACPNGGYYNYPKAIICDLKPLSFKCIGCNCDSRNYFFKLYRLFRQFVQNKIVCLNDRLNNVITISNFSENILLKTLSSNVNVYRVYNPIEFDNDETKINYKKNKYFLYVGRVSKEKGVDIFCEAISSLDANAIVVGDGDQKKILEKKYPQIDFVGWKDKDEVKKYMSKAMALVFPSRWYETAGLTILEAMSLGIPCIVSSCSAASEFVNKNKNGLLFEPNVKDLRKCIKKFLNKEISFDRIDLGNYVNHNYYDDLLKVYMNILEG